MKLLLEYMRTIIISFEFLVLAGVISTLFLKPDFVQDTRDNINLNPDVVKWLALVPAGCLTLILRDIRKVLFPERDLKVKLQNWENYWRLRVTVNVGIIYGVCFVVMSVVSWLINWDEFGNEGLVLMVGAVIGACVDYLTVYFASVTVEEIYAKEYGTRK